MTTTFKIKILSLGLFLTSYLGIFAQSFDIQYKKAVDSRHARQFAQADSLFKIILRKHKRNLPEALCYHYGVVLYELRQTEKAKSFLHKYLSFTNNQSFKDSTHHYLTLMDASIPVNPKTPEKTAYADTCDQCHGKGIALQDCHRCSGSGKILCYQCKGTGLVGTSSDIGTSKFNKCNICNGSGSMLCALCKGDKTIEDKCAKCKGKGKIIIYK